MLLFEGLPVVRYILLLLLTFLVLFLEDVCYE